jgi:hypothetical protein
MKQSNKYIKWNISYWRALGESGLNRCRVSVWDEEKVLEMAGM